jgi:hypothetical protein
VRRCRQMRSWACRDANALPPRLTVGEAFTAINDFADLTPAIKARCTATSVQSTRITRPGAKMPGTVLS